MANTTNFNPGYNNDVGSFAPDLLLAGDHPIRTRGVTISSGQGVLARGTLLGIITVGGNAILSLAAATDGSEVPTCILGEDVDATSAAVNAFAYVAGDFNENQMTFGTGHTADSVRDGLRERSIYLHNPVVAE